MGRGTQSWVWAPGSQPTQSTRLWLLPPICQMESWPTREERCTATAGQCHPASIAHDAQVEAPSMAQASLACMLFSQGLHAMLQCKCDGQQQSSATIQTSIQQAMQHVHLTICNCANDFIACRQHIESCILFRKRPNVCLIAGWQELVAGAFGRQMGAMF